MTRSSQLRAWLILLSASAVLIVACSSSSSTGTVDDKDSGAKEDTGKVATPS
jgi:hypothetical protein